MTSTVMKKFPSPTGVNYYEFRNLYAYLMNTKEFPSPTGVNYYESSIDIASSSSHFTKQFPSPTGVNYYELIYVNLLQSVLAFPSPTGVNYYEL